MLIKEEFDRKDSSQSSAHDSDSDDEIGPKAHMSLLDQHSKLKQQAEGLTSNSFKDKIHCGMYIPLSDNRHRFVRDSSLWSLFARM